MRLSCRERDGDTRASVWRRVDGELAAQHPHALAQADQPQPSSPRRGGRIEPAAIIGHLHHEMAVELIERYGDAPCLGVRGDVAQGFLRDAKEAQCRGAGYVSPRFGYVEMHRNPAFLAEIITAFPERF